MNKDELMPLLAPSDEAAIGRRARAALEASSADLSPDIAFRLAQSRQRAIALYTPRRSLIARLQPAGFFSTGLDGWIREVLVPAIGIVMLALIAAAAGSYSEAEKRDRMVDIDSALLTDDLPIDAYLDRGFGAWVDGQGGR
ncbi:MAG: DUF3619 family protein [Methyloversatilis sp.]|jgi:hypothetical protein|nr:DUF3619 family protein [Methyloversatilis sp.]MBP6194976.1 DUF3619 family protein [Methyloversatilis sp.]MBP9118237.1 DUF3619 family protein [Methyloversatilis sp.]